MRDMNDKVVLVTGATDGIGKVTALELARLGAQVVLVGRNPTKGQAVVREIRTQSGNQQVELMTADLSSQAEIQHLADEFKSRYARLDVLVNNAGATFFSRLESVDGIEMTFALNHLNYFLLTHLLLDLLKASAPARIVNVSSGAHRSGRMNFADLEGKQSFGGWRAYSQSKLANVLFTYELARRLEGTGVTANALHPGFVATRFGHNNGALANAGMKVAQSLFAVSPEKGAETNIYLAASPDVEGVSGQYFEKSRAVSSSKASYDEAAARQLWAISEQMTGIRAPAGV